MRCDNTIRCFKTITAMQKRGGVSACELAGILEVSKRTAYRYIAAASVSLLVFEHDTFPKRFELSGKIGNKPHLHEGVWRMTGSL